MSKIQNRKKAKEMYATPIRKVDGLLDINFFAEGAGDNAVRIIDTDTTGRVSTTNPSTLDHARQLFQKNLSISRKITAFDARATKGKAFGIPLNGTHSLVSEDSNLGWIGNSLSGQNRRYTPSQVIEVRFLAPRRLPKIVFNGLDYDDYPSEFNLVILFGTHHEEVTSRLIIPVKVDDNTHEIIIGETDFAGQITFSRSSIGSDELNQSEFAFYMEDDERFERDVIGARLEILEWTLPNVLPRITYFAGEMHEGFDRNNLRSIDILEEKTGNQLGALSYGISANECKASFLNRNKMFNRPENFRLLKKGRSVRPFIRLVGNPKTAEPLGRFFSESWKLDAESMFMSVTAYDVLYSLQNLIINYGVDEKSLNIANLDIRPFVNIPMQGVIGRVLRQIEYVRRKNGLFESIETDMERLSEALKKVRIPVVLIDKNSAWNVLEQIANFACAYIYADRRGKVVIAEDEFDERRKKLKGLEQYNSPNGDGAIIAYKKTPATFTISNSDSIEINGLHEYTYNARLFATTETKSVPAPIKVMANYILDKYGEGVDFVKADWKGDPGLKLCCKFDAKSPHDPRDLEPKTYETLSNSMSLGQGFEQTTTGRCIGDVKLADDEDGESKILIDADNAFSFSIPVESRTVVNQVNVKYYVLERERDNFEMATIKRRDCTFELDENDEETDCFTATVKLDKVYSRISQIQVESITSDGMPFVEIKEIVFVTASSIEIKFLSLIDEWNNDEFVIRIN
ncbi:MAG: hypothetical protein FWC80_03275 [Firmicutes bacterium]|nr:hypothetical protein [Bacillota bacterium]